MPSRVRTYVRFPMMTGTATAGQGNSTSVYSSSSASLVRRLTLKEYENMRI